MRELNIRRNCSEQESSFILHRRSDSCCCSSSSSSSSSSIVVVAGFVVVVQYSTPRIGLVVRGPSRQRRTWVQFPLSPWIFFRVESYQWITKKFFPVVTGTLPGVPRYRVSTGTGWSGVSILRLGEMESFICNFYLSVAARQIVWADPSLRYTRMLLGR